MNVFQDSVAVNNRLSSGSKQTMVRQGSKSSLVHDDSKTSLAVLDIVDVASQDSVSVSGSETSTHEASPKDPPSSTESLVASTAASLSVREETSSENNQV